MTKSKPGVKSSIEKLIFPCHPCLVPITIIEFLKLFYDQINICNSGGCFFLLVTSY